MAGKEVEEGEEGELRKVALGVAKGWASVAGCPLYIPAVADLSQSIEDRYRELKEQGAGILKSAGGTIWVIPNQAADAHAYLTAAANLVAVMTGGTGLHSEQARRVLADDKLDRGVPFPAVTAMRGVLEATYDDMKHGLLTDVRYATFAVTFDDFLDQAAGFQMRGKMQESAVLASAVLEDAMRRVAEKHGVTGTNMEQRIDELVKLGVFSPTYAKRVKSWAAVRTSAFHARWDELDLPTVGAAILGIRELIETHLG